MRRSSVGKGAVIAAAVLSIGWLDMPAASAESLDAGKGFTKLSRGFINIVTGWVEVPKRIQETSDTDGTFAGFTWGLLRGLGHGFIRTSAGLYEFLTFPFPAPPGYEPVIQPPYVF